MVYKLVLFQEGLMEYEGRVFLTDYAEVEADSLREAKQLWAEKTGNNGEYWNPESQTYWGWQVKQVY